MPDYLNASILPEHLVTGIPLAFTAQEEAGKSWRYLLEWFRRFGSSTNQLIVVDTSPYPDFDTAKSQNVVLRNKDANAHFNQALTHKLML